MEIIFMLLLTISAHAEVITWEKIPAKRIIVTGAKGTYSSFTTNSSTTYKGYFSAVATSSTGHLSRRMWFSICVDRYCDTPLKQEYRPGKNACDVSGVDLKLSWSQEDKPSRITTCKLELNTRYNLNYSQSSFGSGAEPTAKAAMIRGASTSGK